MSDKKIRVLIAKPGLDGHDRGLKVVARGLRDAGMEVIYFGLRLTPEQIAQAAIQEDVDVVGMNCLSGAHMALFPKVVELIRAKGGKDVLVVGGGIIPKKDIPRLKEAGIAAVFGPGTPLDTVANFIKSNVGGKKEVKITKVNHIGIAVSNIDEAVKLYTEVLGLKVSSIEVMAEQKAKTCIIPVGETKLELLESTAPDGVIAKHIEKRGEGLHHIALEVSNIQEALDAVSQKGIALVDTKPRKGVENSNIAFLHPKNTKVLLEFVEPGK